MCALYKNRKVFCMVQANYEVGFSWTCTSCATLVICCYVVYMQQKVFGNVLTCEESADPPKLNNRAVRFSWKRSPALAKTTWREVSDVRAKALPDLLNRVGGTSYYGDKLSKWRRPLICERSVWQDADKNSALRTEVCAASAAWLGHRKPSCGSWVYWTVTVVETEADVNTLNTWTKY